MPGAKPRCNGHGCGGNLSCCNRGGGGETLSPRRQDEAAEACEEPAGECSPGTAQSTGQADGVHGAIFPLQCRGRRDHKRPATAADHGANLSNRLITSSARSQTTGPADGAICFWQSRGQRDQDRPAAKAEIRCDRDRPTNLELSASAQRLAELPQPRGVRSRVTDRTRAQRDHTRPAAAGETGAIAGDRPGCG